MVSDRNISGLAPAPPFADAALTYSDYVFDHLRSDIVGGAYPPLTKLAMRDLTDRYKVGLSPIREALHRLVGEGLVQSVGQRGFTVPPLSLPDLEDLTALRTMVEEAAIRQAIVRGDDAWEARLVAAFHLLEKQIGRFTTRSEGAIRQYDAVHRQFHCALYAGISPRLATLQANLFDQAFRYRKSLHSQPVSARQVLDEHRELMNAALSRDVRRAVAAVRDHLQLTRAATQHLLPAPERPLAKKRR